MVGSTPRVSATNVPANTDLQTASSAYKRTFPDPVGNMTFFVNFPFYAKMCLDMIRLGSGYDIKFTLLSPGTDLRKHAPIADLVDVAILPKVIGGEAVSVDADGKVDESKTRGVDHLTLSAFLKGFEE